MYIPFDRTLIVAIDPLDIGCDMQLSLLDWKSMYLFAGIRADFKFLLYVGQLGHINIDSILWRYQYSRRTQVMADIIWRFDRNSFFQFACLLRSLLPSILYFLVKDRGGCCPRPFCMRAQGCLAPLSRLVLYMQSVTSLFSADARI